MDPMRAAMFACQFLQQQRNPIWRWHLPRPEVEVPWPQGLCLSGNCLSWGTHAPFRAEEVTPRIDVRLRPEQPWKDIRETALGDRPLAKAYPHNDYPSNAAVENFVLNAEEGFDRIQLRVPESFETVWVNVWVNASCDEPVSITADWEGVTQQKATPDERDPANLRKRGLSVDQLSFTAPPQFSGVVTLSAEVAAQCTLKWVEAEVWAE